MNQPLQAQIKSILDTHVDPYLQKTWGEVQAVQEVTVVDAKVQLRIQLGYPSQGFPQQYTQAISEKLLALPAISEVDIHFSTQIVAHSAQAGIANIPKVKNIIAIASGKGGVGKSTTAVNLASALSLQDARVGILDADIYGPNQPHMLGATDRLSIENGQALPPRLVHGMQSMSMGYLIDPQTPMVWRGPMVSSALQQLAHDTAWDDLDYLIIDLPPGTGDIQLTLAQKIPVNGAVIVSTPQDIALLDARKGLEMFRKVNVAVLGIIENMSMHVCSHCGQHEAIFGEGGAAALAQDCVTELLGQLPLTKMIREQADKGVPIVLAYPDSEPARLYQEIARKLAAKLSLQPKSYATRFPKVVVENSSQ